MSVRDVSFNDEESSMNRKEEIAVYVDRHKSIGKQSSKSLNDLGGRLRRTHRLLKHWEGTGWIDVGCGSPQSLSAVRRSGRVAEPLVGVEPIPTLVKQYAEHGVVFGAAHDLPFPDDSFDYGTSFDVIEHLAIGDEVLCLEELKRVSRKAVAVTIALTPARSGWKGQQLHINLRRIEEWDAIIGRIYEGWDVQKLALNNKLPMIGGGKIQKVVISMHVTPLWIMTAPTK